MLDKKIFLISHIADPDGLTAVILGKLVFKNFEYALANVDEVDENVKKVIENPDYDEIHVVDLNITEQYAEEINNSKYKNKIKIFDHHISNIGLNKCPFINVIDEKDGHKECGTSIYYNYLNSLTKNEYLQRNSTKELVERVRLLDTWEWEKVGRPEAKDLDIIFSMYGREGYVKKYLRFIKTHEEFSYTAFDKKLIKIENEKIQRYLEQKEKEMMKIKLDGDLVGLVYAERYRSELGNYLIRKYDELSYIVLINISRGISYRGKDRADLSVISKKRGGGGHKNAAGSPLPKDLLKNITELIFEKVEWENDNQ